MTVTKELKPQKKVSKIDSKAVKVEICAGCGTVSKRESKKFKCSKCGSDVSVVVSREIFEELVKEGMAKKE